MARQIFGAPNKLQHSKNGCDRAITDLKRIINGGRISDLERIINWGEPLQISEEERWVSTINNNIMQGGDKKK